MGYTLADILGRYFVLKMDQTQNFRNLDSIAQDKCVEETKGHLSQ